MSAVKEHDDIATELLPSRQAADGETTSFILSVIEGPDKGKTFTIDGSLPSRVFVGQNEGCEIRLTDPMVSRRHLALDLTDQELRLTDLSSTNRTIANGMVTTEAYLRGGEVLSVGSTVLRVDRVEHTNAIPVPTATRFGRMIGSSIEMRRLYPLCERIAQSDIPVVIGGETGTGKEVLAESIHEQSKRANGPFMVFDCTAVPPSLLESELFGHERGAFTGAVQMRKGLFEQAHGGTLFIDEIGDLELALQPKLLRALQRSEVRRIGGDRYFPVDVRIVAATRRDLDREVQAGRFRDDLFFRLAVARIELPPLRQRRGDVAVLAQHFWKELGATTKLPHDLLQRYEEYAWPGNVRELYNAVSRQLALGDVAPSAPWLNDSANETGDAHSGASAADIVEQVLKQDLPLPLAREKIVEDFERRYVERIVQAHGGNVSRAAAASGIGHRYFQKLRARLK